MPQPIRSAYALRITRDARYSCAKRYLNPAPSTMSYLSQYEYFNTSPYEDRCFPRELQLTPNYPEQFVLPDVVGMSVSEFCVNQAVRAFIEQIEGDKHDFTPIEVRIAGNGSTTFFFFERGLLYLSSQAGAVLLFSRLVTSEV
jgi:hypothetical protein